MIGFGNSFFVSTILDTELGTPPVNTVAPLISGTTTLGSTLTSTTGTWTGTPTITYAYQWKRNGNNIGGATSSTYTLVVADSAAAITCQVTATNGFGSASATSNTITAGTYTTPVNTVAPVISGTQVVGSSLSSTTGTWTGSPTPTFTYQWYRGATLISGATSSSYTLIQTDAGNTSNITCQVTGTNALGNATATSNTLAQIFDFDANAFITAASITDNTQKAAINTLTIDLKGYSIWTKMKAIYPFVGGTSSTHKYNLKDPRDLDAAFRLVFSGGWTHSSTGALPNGTNAYADTKLVSSTNLSVNSSHLSLYTRTQSTSGAHDIGNNLSGNFALSAYYSTIGKLFVSYSYPTDSILNTNTNTKGFIIGSRTASNSAKMYFNNSLTNTLTTTRTSNLPAISLFLAATNVNSTPSFYSNRQFSFTSIGDGLTDAEAANLYTAVQAFQTTLGRSMGTQTVSDADAQAFVNAAAIDDQVEANAINNLVIGLKADSLWSKMKAIYPFVGGTSSTHKWNLKDPRDLDAAFRLVFNGGWTHSSTGALPNGGNGWANTFVNVSTHLALNSTHVSSYSRTNNSTAAINIGNTWGGAVNELSMWLRDGSVSYLRVNTNTVSIPSNTDSRGLFIGNRNSSTQQTLSIRGTQNDFNVNSNSVNSTETINLSSAISGGSRTFFDNKEYAFASIGDGLTSQNMTDLTTRVTTFQTALNRNV